MGFRFYHNNEVGEIAHLIPQNLHFCEFGVYTGDSTKTILNLLSDNGIGFSKVFGFDSFIGLPKVDNEWISDDWVEGNFSAINHFQLSLHDTKNKLREIIGHEIVLIDGWFSDTLNKDCIQRYNIGKVGFVNIDVDLYSSTCQVLDFLFQNQLLSPGTIIRYDDWRTGAEWETGNSKAHQEKRNEYNAIFKRVGQNIFQYIQ